MPHPPLSDPRLLLLSPGDSVYVLRAQLAAAAPAWVAGVAVAFPQPLGLGHKIARIAIAPGAPVIKYGAPIGRATQAIAPGDHVHLHNLKSDYTPTYALEGKA